MEEKPVQEQKIRFGIKFKLSVFVILLIGILTSIIAFILTFTITRRESRNLADQLYGNMTVAIDYLSSTAKDGIIALDDLLVLNIVQKVAAFRDVEYVVIADRKNQVISDSRGFDRTGQKVEDEAGIAAFRSVKNLIQPEFKPEKLEKHYEISAPIVFRARRIGTARIGYSTTSIFKSLRQVRRNILLYSIGVMLSTILLGVFGSIVVASFTTRPIRQLIDGIRVVGKGDLDHVIRLKTKDEIGYLASEFNRTTVQLKEFQKVMVEREVERNQLEMAKSIQKSLTPQAHLLSTEVHVASYSKTVYGVGGDYYDYFPIGEDKVCILICDVFGKGLPASLVMVIIRTLLHSYKDSEIMNTPSEIISTINKRIVLDFKYEQYATLFFVLLNYKTGKIICTNAGHSPLLIYRRSEDKLLFNDFGDVPIGMESEMKYTQFETQLKKGDLIILHTDGITEAENVSGEQYQDQRLKSAIVKNKNNDAKAIVENVIKEVNGFTVNAPQHDDMTLIIVEYLGAGTESAK